MQEPAVNIHPHSAKNAPAPIDKNVYKTKVHFLLETQPSLTPKDVQYALDLSRDSH